MYYSTPGSEIILIFRYHHITTQIKQYLTCTHDILQTCDCRNSHIKMVTIIKIGFTFSLQLASPVIKISGQDMSWHDNYITNRYLRF